MALYISIYEEENKCISLHLWLRVTHLCIRMIKCNISFGNLMEEGFFNIKRNPICKFIGKQDKRNHKLGKNHNPNVLEINLSLHDVLESFLSLVT